MVSLQDTCCLDIKFNPETNSLVFSQESSPLLSRRIPLKTLVPMLLNKQLSYPEHVYDEHVQITYQMNNNINKNGVFLDLLFMPAGLLGVEFIKSQIFYNPPSKKIKVSTIVEVHWGTLTVVMQKNLPKEELDFHTKVEEGLIVSINKGEKLAIPQGYFYTFINAGTQPVVFVRIRKENVSIDNSEVSNRTGLAYYCIRKNARLEVVHNPLYRDVPTIKMVPSHYFSDTYKINLQKSLYTQIQEDLNKFAEILCD